MSVSFVTMTDRRHADHVVRMMRELYAADPSMHDVDTTRFPATIDQLLAEPSRGRILLLMRENVVAGYAIVIPYWSNEFGGTVAIVDELLVEQAFRGQGIARAFFAFLEADRRFDAAAFVLSVSPANVRARALYESVGFHESPLRMMSRRLAV
jgi:ribosomal protein S18 acetylase RimI-like enzyme